MMIIRDFCNNDIDPINKIWEEHHSHRCSLPDRDHAIVDAVIEDDNGKIIAYGQVRHFAEMMMFLDHNISKRDKCVALKLLMMRAFEGLNKINMDQCYAFIHDPDFALLVEKHFGFNRVIQPGEMLLWEG